MSINDVLSEDMETMRQIATVCLADLERASGTEAQQAVRGEHARDALRAAAATARPRGWLQAMQAAWERVAATAATRREKEIAGCAGELCGLAIPMASDGSSRIRSGFRS